MRAIALSLFLCIAMINLGQAQAQDQKAITAKDRAHYNLQQQYSSLKYRSSSHKEFNQEYKVVKLSSLDAFFRNVQDTLKVRQQSIKNAGKETAIALAKTQKELADQKAQVQALQQVNAQKEKQIQQGAHDVASLSVLGLDMDKQVYVWISLLIIAALGAVAAVFAIMYKNSNRVTQEKINAYEDISEELKTHKQVAREKEIKLKRDQQSESNKVEELKQQIADLQKRLTV
ncbi:hypothetical protein TH63_04040 [Rufibacter radiotolerans]|uniref:tRNA (Guanine-N1)-methyltransferase n=1 Tax=Rufibacter radiotolerans TaxID=1379910 RepID=A0A0H4VQ76_9BACT|nr:hypothetical protein [Rufibacter radiotolerans]AKQ47478.1 hypothetical protein TH63_04040 [Rufibacter radiotolerans]